MSCTLSLRTTVVDPPTVTCASLLPVLPPCTFTVHALAVAEALRRCLTPHPRRRNLARAPYGVLSTYLPTPTPTARTAPRPNANANANANGARPVALRQRQRQFPTPSAKKIAPHRAGKGGRGGGEEGRRRKKRGEGKEKKGRRSCCNVRVAPRQRQRSAARVRVGPCQRQRQRPKWHCASGSSPANANGQVPDLPKSTAQGSTRTRDPKCSRLVPGPSRRCRVSTSGSAPANANGRSANMTMSPTGGRPGGEEEALPNHPGWRREALEVDRNGSICEVLNEIPAGLPPEH